MTISKQWKNLCLRHRDTGLLVFALLSLLIAVMSPGIPIKRDIHTYFMIVDISQSMNAMDMTLDHRPASRLEYTKRMMHDIIAQLPCHSKLGIGVFAGSTVTALYMPVQVCQNFSVIGETIQHLEWRMAWSGNSRLRESLFSTAELLHQMPEITSVVYFTDGEEAPLLHAYNTHDLGDFKAGKGWLFAGIGSEKGIALPKLTEHNQVIGYWSNESFVVHPNTAQISTTKQSSGRSDEVAISDYDRFISRRDSRYLQTLAGEIGAQYINADRTHAVLQKMQQHDTSRYEVIPVAIDWLFAIFAAICLLAAYIRRTSVRDMQHTLKLYRKQANTRLFSRRDTVAHENHFQ